MSVTFRFNEILYPRKDKNNYAVGTVINIPFTENGQSFNELSFSASGVLEYRDNRGETLISYTCYNSNAFNWEYDATLSNVSMPNVVVEGYLYNGEFYANYSVEEGYTNKIAGAVNKIYSDKLGTGVYLFDGVYNNVFDLNADTLRSDYYSLSIGDSIYVLAQNGYDLSNEQNVKDVLINRDTQKYYIRNPYRSTYCLQYFKEEQASEFSLLLVSYVWYSHWLNQVYREIKFEDFSLIDDKQYSDATSWLSNNGRITNDYLVTNRDSLDLVAKTIKEQVGDDASVGYYYPDKKNVDNTFVKKIKQLNNTYTHTNNNPASEGNVLEGKSYWRDGEEHIGTMTDYHNNTLRNDKDITVYSTTTKRDGSQLLRFKAPGKLPGDSGASYLNLLEGYYKDNRIVISPDSGIVVSDKIKKGEKILGVAGSPTVIETDAVKNPDFNTQRYNRVTPDTLLDGYGAFMSGEVVYGEIQDYAFPTYENNNAIYPTLPATIATKTDKNTYDNDVIITHANLDDNYARISQNTKITIPFSTFSNEAYPDLKIANYNGTDKVLNDVKQYYPASLSIFGVSGEAYSAQNIESVNENQIWVEGSVIFDIPKNGYYNTYGGIEASYESFVNAYNRLNDDKISSENIKSGKSIFGIPGNSDVINTNQRYLTVGKAPIISSAILTGYSGFVNGQEVVGNYNIKSFVDIKSRYEYISGYSYTISEPVGLSLCVELSLNGTTIEPSGSQYDTNFITDSGSVLKVDLRVVNGTVPSGDAHIKYFDVYINGVPLSVPHYETLAGRITSDNLRHIIASYSYGIPRSCTYQISNVPVDGEENTYALRLDINDAPPFGEKTITENDTYNAIDDGFLGYSKVTVNVAGGGGTDVSDTTALASDVLYDKQFYLANGVKTTGTILTKTNSDITYGKTTTIPAGYYASQCTNTFDEANITASASITDVNNCLTSTQTSFALGYGATVTATTSGWVDAGSLGGDGGARYIKESDFQSNQSISTKAGTVSISEGYTVGGTVGISSTEQAKIIASNIKSGVTILGVTGTYAPSAGGYSCLIKTSDQSIPNQYVCVSGNGFTDYYSQALEHFAASTLSCKANYGPSGTNHVYFNGVEQTLDSNNECAIPLVADVDIQIAGTPGSGATITITNV